MTDTLTDNTWEVYVPSSSEKKQAVLMYMFVGLLLSMGKQEVSPYTYHHLKQAMGRLVLLVAIVFLDVILVLLGMFLSLFSRLAVIITLPVLVIGILCVKQARDGKYHWNSQGALRFFWFFAGLGTWVLNLFDANHYQTFEQESLDNWKQIPTNSGISEIDLSQYEINASVGHPTNQENPNPEQTYGSGQ